MKRVPLPPLFPDLLREGLRGFQGVHFGNRDACPSCGGPVRPHDIKKKRFADLQEGDGEETIRVLVHRFRCRRCGMLSYADEPFYPSTRFGTPIVDLCVVLCQTYPFHRTEGILRQMGILVDRGTIRQYAGRDFGPIPASGVLGLVLPVSALRLSGLGREGGPVPGAEALVSFGLPPARRAPAHPPPPQDGHQGDHEEQEEEREPQQQ
ncbi:MAG: hypothetical protein LUQ64_00490 [Methanomicrobiales archaeon]|nr:hypothetical protein [Methanomicrobiales archaeon]